MKLISLSLVIAFCLVSSTVRAEIASADYSSKVFTFALTYAEGYLPDITGVSGNEKSAITDAIKASFYMTISQGSSDTEAKLTFGLTEFGKQSSFATIDQGVKIQSSSWSISGVEGYFATTSFSTGNQEWIQGDGVLERTSSLKGSQTWTDFVDWMDINADTVRIFAHVQSIYVNSANTGVSVNTNTDSTKSYFVYQAPTEPAAPSTPEPATMLIIGLGLAGLGLARRRK